MIYNYQNAMSKKHYLKCLRKAPEWINQDVPDIYRSDGTRAIECTFPEYKFFVYADNKDEAKQLEQFIYLNTGKIAELYY
ncbi:MAG: hypothetical protein WC549_00435 [Actinomycetota bacterium]